MALRDSRLNFSTAEKRNCKQKICEKIHFFIPENAKNILIGQDRNSYGAYMSLKILRKVIFLMTLHYNK